MKRKTKKSGTVRSESTIRVTMISQKAKEIRKKGEPWTDSIKRASKLLKKQGRL